MERRHHERYRYHAGVTISWIGSEGPVSCPGNCLGAWYRVGLELPTVLPEIVCTSAASC